jgi:hypothetical protein
MGPVLGSYGCFCVTEQISGEGELAARDKPPKKTAVHRFRQAQPIGRTEKEKDSALRPFEGLAGLFMAELIGQSKRRRRLTASQRFPRTILG